MEPKQPDHEQTDIGVELVTFIHQIYGLANALPFVQIILEASHQRAVTLHNQFVRNFGVRKGDEEYFIPAEYFHRFNILDKEMEGTTVASEVVPRSFLVSLVSQFDSYLGHLIRGLYSLRPELMNSSERSLTFAQLMEYDNLEEARESILEKEVESVLRESHIDQFKWLENKFNLPLRKDLPSWPIFVELTERRNLFVHTDGLVSSQYMKLCMEQGVHLPTEVKLGARLSVSEDYFKAAYHTIYEIGTKLTHVLWRKLAPDAITDSDTNLNKICFELIAEENYALAINLLDFSTCTLKKHGNEQTRRIFIINRAQAYKWSGDPEKAAAILREEDWSASSDVFKLCVAVLEERYDQAEALMRQIGPADTHKVNYKSWPVFKEFRKSHQFLKAYEEIFSERFSSDETAKKAGTVAGRDTPTGNEGSQTTPEVSP